MMETLRCLLLPILNQTLMVPYAAIAEVIPFEKPSSSPKDPSGSLLGEFYWRGKKIPLISIEALEQADLNKEELLTNKNLHIAIFNRIADINDFEFMGILIQGIPRMSRYKRLDFSNTTNASKPYFRMESTVRDQ